MKVYDVIEIASQMRPGNTYDTEIIEQWISELDAMIQIEIVGKNHSEIRKMKPLGWEKNKAYIKGDRVSVMDGGKVTVYVAKEDVTSEFSPQIDSRWSVDEYDTYVAFPHDRLYYLYVICMMDYANKEYDKYANDKALYDEALSEFAKWWQRKYRYTRKEGVDEYEAEVRPSVNSK